MPVSVVTLLVNPEEAERLTLASTEGKIQLALRNPLDKTMPVTQGIRPAALLGYGAPTRAGVARATRVGGQRRRPSRLRRSSAEPADGRNHPRRQARARSRAPGAVSHAYQQPSRSRLLSSS